MSMAARTPGSGKPRRICALQAGDPQAAISKVVRQSGGGDGDSFPAAKGPASGARQGNMDDTPAKSFEEEIEQ
jgi:hypothetical protein